MKSMRRAASAVIFCLLLVGAVAMTVAPPAVAGSGGPDDGCPRIGIFCPLFYAPVTCSDGNTYSNSCFAYVACAEDCVPVGPGPVPF